jgi:hypothetical protein
VAVLSRIRTAIVVVLVAGLVVSGYVGYRLFTEDPDRPPRSSKVTGTTDDGWLQVAYRGVTVELPPDWGRLDTGVCEGELERWAPAGHEPCDDDGGLSFLDAATFDPAIGPGVHTTPASNLQPNGGWTGYVTRGDVVVTVSDTEEVVVRRILQSVSVPL